MKQGINILSFVEDVALQELLRSVGFRNNLVECRAENENQVEILLLKHQPQVICVEMKGGQIDGLSLCEMIRGFHCAHQSHLVVLSNNTDHYLHIAALQSGADDYIELPVNERFLRVKMMSWIRRFTPGSVKLHGDLMVDLEAFKVEKQGLKVSLGKKEFEILALLMDKPGVVKSRAEIMGEVWSSEKSLSDRIVDVYVRKLRKSLGNNVIQTVKGVGYRV